VTWGLRTRSMVLFTVSAFIASAALSVGAWFVSAQVLLHQRQSLAERQALAGSQLVALALDPDHPFDDRDPDQPAALVHDQGRWYTSDPSVSPAWIPTGLLERASWSGTVESNWLYRAGERGIATVVPMADGRTFVEIVETTELNDTLRTLMLVLALAPALTTIAAGATSRFAAGRALSPLRAIARTASAIGAGDSTARLEPTGDPDLAPLVSAFNDMADTLELRLQRDARFASDVSHELRSPLTTLVGSVELMQRHSSSLPPQDRRTLDLIDAELQRLRRTLDALLVIGRLDAGQGLNPTEGAAVDLVLGCLTATHRDPALLAAGASQRMISVDRAATARALANVLENAELHGGGVTRVTVTDAGPWVVIGVEDAGPGIPESLRTRVFERFFRAGARASRPGVGLGLSLVRETVTAQGGTVSVAAAPGGGARLELALPAC